MTVSSGSPTELKLEEGRGEAEKGRRRESGWGAEPGIQGEWEAQFSHFAGPEMGRMMGGKRDKRV